MKAPFILGFLFFVRVAFGFDAVLTDDTTLILSGKPLSLGSRPTLTAGSKYAALMKFDLGTIPAGITSANVKSATLTVFVSNLTLPKPVTSATTDLLQISGAWDESAIPSGLTFGNSIQSAVLTNSAKSNFVRFNVTALVKQWIDGTAENDGLALTASVDSPAGITLSLDSKENIATAHTPTLAIDFADLSPLNKSNKGAWIVYTNYRTGDIVSDNGSTWIALLSNIGSEPFAGSTDWSLLALRGLRGVKGDKGDTGATGPQGPAGSPLNPLQAALLKWVPNTVTSFGVGSKPAGICFDGSNIWVSNSGTNTVTKLSANPASAASQSDVTRTVTVGSNPQGICFSGAYIWVANSGFNSDFNSVTQINASTALVAGFYAVAAGPSAICFDGASIWVTGSAGVVTKMGAATKHGIPVTYKVGANPQGICSDGANIWVSNFDDGTVTKLTGSNGATIGTYNIGTTPKGICFDGANIWVAITGGVTKLNASDGTVIGTYLIPGISSAVCFDGTSIWVTSANQSGLGATLTKLASTGAVISSTPIADFLSGGICFDGANIWVPTLGNIVNKF